jgi:selenocysteine-specific elongation factor
LAALALDAAEARVVEHLATFHRREPLQPGCPKQALAEPSGLPDAVLPRLLQRAEARGKLRVERDLVAAAGHSVRFSADERRAHDLLLDAHRRAGVSPPNLPDALAEAGLQGEKARRLVHLLVSSGELVRLREGLLVHRAALAGLVKDMASWYRPGQAFSVPDFKERSGVSRKHAIPLLECLDARGLTRRAGDGRTWTGREPGAPEPAGSTDEAPS